MNRICRRAVAAAGALALTGGTALAASAPASAQPVADNFSYGASTTGFLSSGELALAENSFGRHTATLGHVGLLSNLLTTGNVLDTAFNSGASSNVALVNVRSNLAALGLTARLVRTSCDTNGNLNTTILGGLIGVGGFGQPLPVNPAPNTDVFLPGGITVVLNHQTTVGGQETVDGLYVELPFGEDITVATSSCENDS